MESQGNSQNYEHEIVDNGRTMGWKFTLRFQVPRQFHMKIRNAKADKKKWLELKTNVQLPQEDSTEVIINGNSEREVILTKDRIVKLIRPSQKLSHFLSISLTNDVIKSNVCKFNDEVINDFGLHKSLLQKPEKLHLTITMLALGGLEDESKAIECLKNCKEAIIDPILNGKQLTISLVAVDVFSDENPSAAHVLFGKVVSEDLQLIANKMSKNFADQGIGKPYKNRHSQKQEDVKLHATLINSQFYEEDEQEKKTKAQAGERFQRKPFNASAIIEKYKDFNFGSIAINEIQISRLEGEKDANGYYSSIGTLKF